MPASQQLVWIYIAAAMAVGVVLAALAAAMFIYQRYNIKLHQSYAKKLLEAHEDERAWVAREVHDDALQRVAMLQHELSEWDSDEFSTSASTASATSATSASPTTPTTPSASDTPRATTVRVEALRDELQDLAVMLRRVAHRLHPAIIDQAGLIPALNQLASDVERASGIHLDTQFDDNGEAAHLSRERALTLYRIAQEALRNVVKHSGAKRASVRTRAANGRIEITVQDFGRGFVSTDPARSAGLGLISMAERTRLAEGEFDIRSSPGEGTTVRASVPVNE
ncbi:MAG: hypothetical protein IT359_18790 [Gemmatimonadaceae bacterium]|nr:hypothetical protein [Gemmatimonadaceae bacterium]